MSVLSPLKACQAAHQLQSRVYGLSHILRLMCGLEGFLAQQRKDTSHGHISQPSALQLLSKLRGPSAWNLC